MNIHADQSQKNKSQAVSTIASVTNDKSAFQIKDNRPEAIAQMKLQQATDCLSISAEQGGLIQRKERSGTPLQMKKNRDITEEPSSRDKSFIDRDKSFIDRYLADKSYVAYAEEQYAENHKRAIRIVQQIRASICSETITEDYGSGIYAYNPEPEHEQWEVSPSLDNLVIRGYGLRISYTHKKLNHKGTTKVGYTSTVKRNENGQIELEANDNRGPNPKDRKSSSDPFIKMNLNKIWAHQIGYFLRAEKKLKKSEDFGSHKMGGVKRSTIENPSTLATLWITDNAGPGEVTNVHDWLALSGSPNGSAVLYLILQSPDLGNPLDFKTVNTDPSSMYTLEVVEGPSFIFR